VQSALDVVTVQKWKRPAGSGSWRGYVLGSDGYGCWVFTPAHSTYTGVHPDGHAETCEVAQDDQRVGRSCVVLLPSGGWYVAHWVWRSEHVVDIDIATPPTKFGDVWMYDDLELDPFVDAGGTFGVDDEDEFDIACERGRIGPVARLRALEEVRSLRRRLTVEPSPLLLAGVTRLAEGRALDLVPL
jgi:Uncharacterized conserved protein